MKWIDLSDKLEKFFEASILRYKSHVSLLLVWFCGIITFIDSWNTDVKIILFLKHNDWNASAKKNYYQIRLRSNIKTGYGKVIKVTPFRHIMNHIKTMLLNTKIFCDKLKLYILRICDNFYRNPIRNKKVKDKKSLSK